MLLGGEAYLRSDVLLVIRRIRERGMAASIVTGGLGMTQTRAEALVEAGITTAGVSIKSCPSLGGAKDTAGSWREHGLEALWRGSPELSYMRDRGVEELWGFCKTCYYAETCKAGCTAVSEPLLGRPGNNPYCHHRALELQRQGLRERVEPVATAKGMPFDSGLWRLILEHLDPAKRAALGPVEITEPRISRMVEWTGAGRPLTVDDLGALPDGAAPFTDAERDLPETPPNPDP
ncbi:heme biosynthesis protein [Plesiocystis pacifica SIR-1]|uniref:Heme biosynthesis protein n=1 Tax=Plesiocystis pacifica SIR-1 TaxID=391625 RepID=A6G423_9BACT|nr:hypothetical protein [Plesiocystis pacifica]EDM79346.1 heme biosynthesis protein [Plesiocystis pacifica SIR-1]